MMIDNATYNRLLDEAEELTRRVEALSSFIETDKFEELTPTQQMLLPMQLSIMTQYHDILRLRLDDIRYQVANND